jgi:hypothetical protein
LAAYTVKKFKGKHLRTVVGWATLALGLVSLGKIIL